MELSPLAPFKLTKFHKPDRQLVERAYLFAAGKHAGAIRKSGQPYISHPVAVASYLAELDMDAPTVAAALLHDVVEDTDTTHEDLERLFGVEVARLVDGVTKLGEVKYVGNDANAHRYAISVENIRKLLLAMSHDLRVVMIKLADRLHNMQTLSALSLDDQERIARQTLDIYAPLADRLGMGALKAELEDLAFRYADPAAFHLTKRLVAGSRVEALRVLEQLKSLIADLLRSQEVFPVAIDARQKHLYSIYRKLTKVDGEISKIYDLIALRIIVPNTTDCYKTLGVIHQRFKPLIYRIKDYIAVPKPNGYQSLHTTVFSVGGRIVEIQIRTPQMHAEAEYGLAAHAIYNQHKETRTYRDGGAAPGSSKLNWVGELASLTAGQSGPDMMRDLKIDLFQDRIFVFSPGGDLYDLPDGATPVDFAFAVHTEVGLSTHGARVNGRLVPLDRPLQNRDVVEILTRKNAAPSRGWLAFVATAHARSRIKNWFRNVSRDANITNGRQIIEPRLKAAGYKRLEDVPVQNLEQTLKSLNLKDSNALLAALGETSITLGQVMRRLLPDPRLPRKELGMSALKFTGKVVVTEAPGLSTILAPCCAPKYPQAVIGYITRGSGITVHAVMCSNLPKEPDRLIKCTWEELDPGAKSLIASIGVEAKNRIGLIRDIAAVMANTKTNIVKITSSPTDEKTKLESIAVVVQVGDLEILSTVMRMLGNLESVVDVSRSKDAPDL